MLLETAEIEKPLKGLQGLSLSLFRLILSLKKNKSEVVRMISLKIEKESRIGSFLYSVVNQYNRILRREEIWLGKTWAHF